jgi:plasmid stabilization system protein ParE
VAEVRWTLDAVEDLEAIAEFIARDSPHYAQLFVLDVHRATDQLKDFPESGRIVPEGRDPSLREVLVGNYRIVYRLRQDITEILTVYHGARLLDPSDLG